jgi:hypothetical protein
MTVKHIPPDSAEYLHGPLPQYQDGVFTVKGKKVDANKLKPLDHPEAAAEEEKDQE